jgi:hypothetical protein
MVYMHIPGSIAQPIWHEFDGVRLGDSRRGQRLQHMAEALAEQPDASFPLAAGTDGVLEGTYRFLNNNAVTPEGILAPHFRQTLERSAEAPEVLVIHDTTQFEFGGIGGREGLGRLRRKAGQGFLGHFALAVADRQSRRPLGILGLRTLFRTGDPKGKRSPRQQRLDPDNESRRWLALVEETEERVAGKTAAIHVMDREGDSYALFAEMLDKKRRFIIRAAHDRPLAQLETTIARALAVAPVVCERLVPLSRRRTPVAPMARRIHPGREPRMARLEIRAKTVELKRSRHLPASMTASLKVNIVTVTEIQPRLEIEPVDWTLLTTESIATAEDVERIVDSYRARWTIEEFFKALKTGCAYEKRQLESKKALLNALAVFIPIAWRMLLLRTVARSEPLAPARFALTESQIQVLAATAKRELPSQPTVQQALLAVAALGGHISNNGQPGWHVIARGFQKLIFLEQGWLAAHRQRSDQ